MFQVRGGWTDDRQCVTSTKTTRVDQVESDSSSEMQLHRPIVPSGATDTSRTLNCQTPLAPTQQGCECRNLAQGGPAPKSGVVPRFPEKAWTQGGNWGKKKLARRAAGDERRCKLEMYCMYSLLGLHATAAAAVCIPVVLAELQIDTRCLEAAK